MVEADVGALRLLDYVPVSLVLTNSRNSIRLYLKGDEVRHFEANVGTFSLIQRHYIK